MWKRLSVLVVFGCGLLPVASHGEIEIHGRVLAADGKPQPEAEVVLSEVVGAFELGTLLAAGETHPPPVAITRTDASGDFHLAAPGPGMWAVRVAVDGFLPVEHPLQPLLEPANLGPLTLRPASDLGVRVLDADGRPLAGAFARVTEALRWSRYTDASGGWWPALSLGVSDEEGRLTLPLGRGERAETVAWAPGHLEAFANGQGKLVEVRLRRGQPRTVEVLQANHRPLGGALVRVGKGRWPVGQSDADGRVTVSIPARQAITFEVISVEGEVGNFSLNPARLGIDEPAIFNLPTPRSLVGEVVDASSRAALAGAWIWSRQDPAAFVRSGATGSFSLPLASSPAGLQIAAAAPDYLPELENLGDELTAAEAPIFALEPAARLHGLVVDGDGHAVADARIEARLAARRSPARPMAAASTSTSDDRGRFRISGLTRAGRYELIARAEGFAPTRLEVVAPGTSGDPVRMVLDRGRRAVGAVMDGDELPVAGAEVALTAATKQGPDFSIQAFTDRDGTFELLQLPAGRYDLAVAATGFAPVVVRGLAVSNAEGTADLGTVFLEPGISLEGRVTDVDDQPLAGVSVFAMTQGAAPGSAVPGQQLQTAADGSFSVVDLRPGDRVKLQLWKEGYQNRLVSGLEAPTLEPLTLVLRPASRVSGRVIDGDRQPVARARVGLVRRGSGLLLGGRMLASGSGGLSSVSDVNGEFTIDNVASGRYSLAVIAEGFRPAEAGELEIAEGRDVEGRVISLEVGAVVEGRVLSPAGQPVIGARVAVVATDGSPRPVTTGGDGSYRIAGLATGTTSIEASHRNHQRVVRDLRVHPGRNDLDLTFESGFEVGGRVLSDAGDPVPFARLSLAPGGAVATTDSRGEFTFVEIGNGRHWIRLDKAGYPSVTLGDEVVVEDGPVYGLELLLEAGSAIVGNLLGLDFDELARATVSALRPGRSPVKGVTDHEGGYRIDRLSPGEWTVIAELPGDPRESRGRVVVEQGAPEAVLDLDFSSGLTLSGWVLRRGDPVAGAVILLSDELAPAGAGETNTVGAFQMSGIEAGSYRLTVSHLESGLEHSRNIELDSDRDLILEVGTARLAGLVVDADDHRPVEGAVVAVESLAGSGGLALRPGATTDALGRFNLGGFDDGDWRLLVRGQGYADAEIQVPVRAGAGDENLEIALQATQGLTLEVLRSSGVPARRVRALLHDATGRAVAAGTYDTGEGGRLRIPGAPAGTWDALVIADGDAAASVRVVVPGPRTRVQLPPAGRLLVTVPELTATSRLASASLTAADGSPYRTPGWDGRVHQTWTLTAGRLVLDAVPAGQWNLSVSNAEGRSWTRDVAVQPYSQVEVVLD